MRRLPVIFLFVLSLSLCSCGGWFSKDSEEDEFFLPSIYKPDDSSAYLAVLGDIQYYTNSQYYKLLRSSSDWIVKAGQFMDIRGVIHTGDITQTDNVEYEWPYFDRAIARLSESVPFVSAIGDHDYKWDGALIMSRDNTHFSEHVAFPIVAGRIEASYEEGRWENIVVRNEIHGERYDIMVLEFGPRKEVVAWANAWVASHPQIKYFLVNHEYLEEGGGRRVKNLKCRARLQNTSYSTPEELWKNLVWRNDNIVAVLSGHTGGLYAYTKEANCAGREVCQIQHNIQDAPYRYDNWLMLWKFPVDSDDAVVSIFNTKTGVMYDKDTLFTFQYRY